MADYIKIYDDTILKQSIRQGTEEQRKSCMFTSGELAYTRDTKRVFVGDYSNQTNSGTPGGIIVGNKFILDENTHYTGDYTFDENYNNLIIYTSETDEQTIPIIKVDGTSIIKDVSNVISLGTVELNKISDYFSTDYFNHSNDLISLNDSITLNSLTLDEIYPKTNDFISIPNKLKLNNIETSLHINKPSEEINGKMTGFVEIEKINDTYIVDFKPNNKTLTINLHDGLHDGKNPNNNILTIDNETNEISIGLKIDLPQNSQDSSTNQDSDLENHIIEKPKPIIYRISDNFENDLNTNFLFIISNPNTSQEQNDNRILSCIYKSNDNFNNSIIGNDTYSSSCVFGHSIPLEKEDYFISVIDEEFPINQFASILIQNSQDFIYKLIKKSDNKFYFSEDSEQFGLQNEPIKTIQISTNNPSEMWEPIFDSNNASNDSVIFNTDDDIFKNKNKCPYVLKITTENSSESIYELLDKHLSYNQTLTITSDMENYTINGYECDQIYHQFTDGTNNTINVGDITTETYKKSESKLLNFIKNDDDNNLIISYKIYNGSEIIEQYDISQNEKSMVTDEFYVSNIGDHYYINNKNVFTSFELQLFGEDSSKTYDAKTVYDDFERNNFNIVSSVAYTVQNKMLKSINFNLNDTMVQFFDFNELEFVFNEEDTLPIEKPYGTITELDFQFTDVTISSNGETSEHVFQNFIKDYVDENNTIIAEDNIDYFEFKNSEFKNSDTDTASPKMIVYLKNAHGYKDTYKNPYTPNDDKEIEQLKCSSNAKYLLFESHSDLEYAELTYSIINNEQDIIENTKYVFPFQVKGGEIISNEQQESIKVIDVIDKSCAKLIQVPVSSNIFDSKSGIKINIQCSKLQLPEIEPVLPDDSENPDQESTETNESNENEEVITYKNKCNFVLRYIGYTV